MEHYCEKCEQEEKKYENRLWWARKIVTGLIYYGALRVAFSLGKVEGRISIRDEQIRKQVREKLNEEYKKEQEKKE